MRRIFTTALLVVAFVVGTSVCATSTFAQQGAECVAACGNGCCDGATCCCGTAGPVGAVELLFMKYMQEGGVADRDGTGGNFDLELAPRFELGYQGQGDFGARMRYFKFDHATLSNDADVIGIDTYYLDAEVYVNRWIGRTSIDLAAGFRYLDFRQNLTGGGADYTMGEFEGYGGTLAVEARRPIWVGSVYARARLSLLLGNHDIDDNGTLRRAHDSQSTMTELALGYEVARDMGDWGVAVARAGAEWQTWTNLAPADTVFGGVGNDDVLENVGFAGLVARLELRR